MALEQKDRGTSGRRAFLDTPEAVRKTPKVQEGLISLPTWAYWLLCFLMFALGAVSGASSMFALTKAAG